MPPVARFSSNFYAFNILNFNFNSYVNGDLGFDPLGFKPRDQSSFDDMRTKELQNGRLAMIGTAGIVAQELVNGKGIWETYGFSHV